MMHARPVPRDPSRVRKASIPEIVKGMNLEIILKLKRILRYPTTPQQKKTLLLLKFWFEELESFPVLLVTLVDEDKEVCLSKALDEKKCCSKPVNDTGGYLYTHPINLLHEFTCFEGYLSRFSSLNYFSCFFLIWWRNIHQALLPFKWWQTYSILFSCFKNQLTGFIYQENAMRIDLITFYYTFDWFEFFINLSIIQIL